MLIRVLSLTAIVGTAGVASATLINGSFESDVAGVNNLTVGTPITGWSTGGTGQGSWDIRDSTGLGPWTPFWNQTAPDGNQIAYINDGPIAQQTGYMLEAGVQTLGVSAGNRADGTFSADFSMQIWAGGTVSNGTVSGGTLLATQLIRMVNLSPGTFSRFEVSHTTLPGDALIGQLLTVRFANFAGHQINIDDVTFQAVPEPGTLMALGAGIALLLRRRRCLR